jgi:hypothetical protein
MFFCQQNRVNLLMKSEKYETENDKVRDPNAAVNFIVKVKFILRLNILMHKTNATDHLLW